MIKSFYKEPGIDRLVYRFDPRFVLPAAQ